VILIDYRQYLSIPDVLFKVKIWFLKQTKCRGEKKLLQPCALVSLVVKLLTVSLYTILFGHRIQHKEYATCLVWDHLKAQVLYISNHCLWAPGLLLPTFYDLDGLTTGLASTFFFAGRTRSEGWSVRSRKGETRAVRSEQYMTNFCLRRFAKIAIARQNKALFSECSGFWRPPFHPPLEPELRMNSERLLHQHIGLEGLLVMMAFVWISLCQYDSRSLLFWDATQRRLVDSYRLFGTIYWYSSRANEYKNRWYPFLWSSSYWAYSEILSNKSSP
jgi:hypothetical protein